MAGIAVISRIALIARSDLNALSDLSALNARSGTAGRKLIVLALKCLVSDSDRAALRADRYGVGDDREGRVASSMKRIRWGALHALWLGVVALVPVWVASEAVAIEDPRWQLSSSLTYESGTFGT